MSSANSACLVLLSKSKEDKKLVSKTNRILLLHTTDEFIVDPVLGRSDNFFPGLVWPKYWGFAIVMRMSS